MNTSSGWGLPGSAAAVIAARLTLTDLSRSYGDVHALARVSIDVSPGEILCLLGQSGCGKTTLLRVVAGLEVQTSGCVLIDDQMVSGPGVFTPPEARGVGLMFQDYALFPHLTILQNVAFGLNDIARSDARRAALSALIRVGLERYADDYPHMLSGGEQQRVALARALVPRPGVLLMDEPFSGLDVHLRREIRDETLAVLHETRATSVIVTHDPHEALCMADRIALMRAGKLVQVGTPAEIYHAPADLFAARFFSEFNEIPGVARDSGVETALGFLPISTEIVGPVWVCIRPHGVMLRDANVGAPGKILYRRFFGETDLAEIMVGGWDRPLKALVTPNQGPRRGEVGVEFDPEHILLFPRNGDVA